MILGTCAPGKLRILRGRAWDTPLHSLPAEPQRLADAVAQMGLKACRHHQLDRDDFAERGSGGLRGMHYRDSPSPPADISRSC